MTKIIMITFGMLFSSIAFSVETEFQVRLCGTKENLMKLLPDNYSSKQFTTYYLETSDKKFLNNGLAIRLRVSSSKVEVTVKKKEEKHVLNNTNRICEFDQHGDVEEYSCKINNDIEVKKFNKLQGRNIDWKELLTKDQLILLNENIEILPDAVLYGVLDNERYRFDDKTFGEVTFDLVKQVNKSDITYHEVSFRFKHGDSMKGKEFIQFLVKKNIPMCENQVDWPINKFDTLDVLN